MELYAQRWAYVKFKRKKGGYLIRACEEISYEDAASTPAQANGDHRLREATLDRTLSPGARA